MDSLGFVKKWAASTQSERATAQEHFIDLCRLLNEQTPNEADPTGDLFAFEKGAKRPDGDGFADVWLKGHFAWEYKGKHKDLGAAYKQVQTYREALGNPPLLVVSDIEHFEIHTNWTNTETWIYKFRNADIASDVPVEVITYSGPAADAPKLIALQVLKVLFEEPDRLRPLKTTDQITQDAARLFGRIAGDLRKWKVDDMRIARKVARSGDATGVPWWIHQRPRPDMREALAEVGRYIATPRLTKHRLFVWMPQNVLCDAQLIVFARDDDYFFGVLHSRVHEVWARATGTQLREVQSGFRYTPTSCFETFPLPHASQEQQAAIAEAARELDALRQNWLNPPEGSLGPKELRKRTLTNLYNKRPTWLANAHRDLDAAVFAAYGWPEPPDRLTDVEIVDRLLALNLQREPA